jgi:hypothetical protein
MGTSLGQDVIYEKIFPIFLNDISLSSPSMFCNHRSIKTNFRVYAIVRRHGGLFETVIVDVLLNNNSLFISLIFPLGFLS